MNKKAFTLIELLVVVLIIGILAAIALPQYQKAVSRTRVMELMTLVRHIKNMQEEFYMANGQYASGCNELAIDFPSGYEPDEADYLVNTNKYFKLDCNRGRRYSTDEERSAGLWTPAAGGTLSIEMTFDNSSASYKTCYATSDTLKAVCKNICGTSETPGTGGWACDL